jgi:hypothetical protein
MNEPNPFEKEKPFRWLLRSFHLIKNWIEANIAAGKYITGVR